jgi:hypothetical protein
MGQPSSLDILRAGLKKIEPPILPLGIFLKNLMAVTIEVMDI